MRALILLALTACATTPAPSQSVIDVALDAVAQHPAASGEAVLTRVQSDELGMTHVRVQQYVHDVPVFEGQAIVHVSAGGRVTGISDKLAEDVSVDTTPLYDADDAVQAAVDEVGGWGRLTDDPEVDLWVLRRDDGDHLAWRVQLQRIDGSPQTSMPLAWVDAHSGELLDLYDNLHTAATTGTGVSNYSGTVSLRIYEDGGDYYLEDTTYNLGTYSYGNTYSSLYYITDTDTAFEESWQAEGVDGHYAGAATLAFYEDSYGLDGIDGSDGPGYVSSLTGSGSTISVLVNYGRNYTNAGWAGSYLLLGDGDGTTYTELTSVDIVGHEMTHGVTENSANLTYQDESGAIDEATSDVFGAMVERSVYGQSADTWMMGEDVYTPGTSGDALRYMNDPTLDGVSVDHYDDRYTGSSDNGGVHINNGIGNLAFYLMAEGGTHPTYGGSMTGIGADDAAAIWYRGVHYYMTSSTDYADARTAMLSAATDLYGAGGTEYKAVEDAWALVGVGTASTCHPGADGAYNYCSADCPCAEGEGDCDSDSECDSGLSCGDNNGADYGFAWYVDACATSTSCHPGSNGVYNYCSASCPCAEGEGDCDSDAQCDSGLSCGLNNGADYGLDWYVDVCEATASCHPGSNGVYNYCSAHCPCAAGEGDCDSDAQCDSGLSCGDNNGADYGLDWYVDVCE